jgi:hypothetical protein
MLQSLSLKLSLAVAAVGVAGGAVLAQPAAEPAVPVAAAEDQPTEFQERLITMYLAKFGEGLDRDTRLPRLISLLAVARLDDARAVPMLLHAGEAAVGLADLSRREQRAKLDPVVAWLAWEALHTRHQILDDHQRQRWLRLGVAGAAEGAFPNELAIPVLNAAASLPAGELGEQRVGQLVVQAVQEGNPVVLPVVADAVAAWRDPAIVRALMGRNVLNEQTVDGIAQVLAKLPDAPVADVPGSPGALRQAWNGWFSTASGPAGPEELTAYAGQGTVLPPPEKMSRTGDGWNDIFEADDLVVRGIDLAWSIDSTGSMAEENQAVARATVRVMMLLSVVSDRTRVGTLYVRHETFGPLQGPCCTKAEQHPAGYTAKPYPLSPDVVRLANIMFDEPIPKPNTDRWANTHPGSAAHSMLFAADRGLEWSAGPNVVRAVVAVADSEIKPDRVQPAAMLARDMAQRGFQVHALHTRQQAAFEQVFVEGGGGSLLQFKPRDGTRSNLPAGPLASWDLETASDWTQDINAFEQIALNLINGSVPPEYESRVHQAVIAVSPFLRQAFPEAMAGVEEPRQQTRNRRQKK